MRQKYFKNKIGVSGTHGKSTTTSFLVDLFKEKNNPWVTKARTLNARFTALSVLVLVPVFLGFMLPAINERATKKRINEEKAAAEKQKADSLKAINPDFFAQSQKTQNIFSDFQ